ncbi:hypothetical protein [Lacipirellula limnantheis]|uniref:Uncharacterized protein n=1 Tax=Lacipirellula limnantheis TaxID=2528024 RepID=A0A517TYX0_9BACT|nr:hypothetical protein [Lacipirellula limnantheis]QDT73573.1 hypothetical protein I41_27620 [Lacipirellula limnantheis]
MPTNTEATTTPQSAWQVVAELPYGGSLTTVHQQVRTLRHLVVDPYDASQDNAIHFALRGYRFRMEQVDDRLDFWVNDGSCPVGNPDGTALPFGQNAGDQTRNASGVKLALPGGPIATEPNCAANRPLQVGGVRSRQSSGLTAVRTANVSRSNSRRSASARAARWNVALLMLSSC